MNLKTYTYRDIVKYNPTMSKTYLRQYVKPTGDWKLDTGHLLHTYTLESIRTAMTTKRNITLTATRLCTRHRIQSLTNIANLLYAVEQLEKETK